MKSFRIALSLLFALGSVPVMASSTYTGVLSAVYFGQDAGTGQIRITLALPTSTTNPSCGNTTYYAFEYNGTGLGSVWVATLIAAQASGSPITVAGSGSCDNWAMEGVSGLGLP